MIWFISGLLAWGLAVPMPGLYPSAAADEPFELNGVGEAALDAIPKETNLTRWDIPWGGTPTDDFYRLSGSPGPSEVIWRGGTRGSSAFGDAVWGLIMDAREAAADNEPAAWIYHKTDLSARANTLQVVARTNPGDATLSGRGAIRLKAAYKVNGSYEAITLTPQLSDAQLGDTAAAFAVTPEGWTTFEAPPLVDQSDTFSFDIRALAGRSDVVFFIEANDRMESGANRTDRLIVLAVRIREGSLPGPESILGLTQQQLLELPKETDLGKWDIAWGPHPVSTFYSLSGPPSPAAAIWRGEASGASAFGDAGYGLIMDARESGLDDAPATLIYNKADLAMNASKLQLIARSGAASSVLSGRGAIRVQAAYQQDGAYVVVPLRPELTVAQQQDAQAQFAVTADRWVTFEAPPQVDVSDSFSFDLLPVAGRADVVFFIETNDRPESGANRTDRVILLAVRVTNAWLEEEAQIVDTVYATDEIVIADVVAEPLRYDVDPTGQLDSTAGIRQALQDVYAAGGGTVFLPSGQYRVTGNVTIPPFTALRGDYQDPDRPGFDGNYGTVLLADVASRDTNFPSLLTVGGSAAAIGLTIYYPEQDAASIKPYPYTFEIPSFAGAYGHGDHMAPTIKDVTLINAYRGIAASITVKGDLISAANEMLHLENIKGTVLYRGAELYNSSEYGVVRQLSFGNRYWAEASAAWNPPARTVLDAFTLQHGIGLQMGDLEWVQFTDISLSDYKLGVRLFDGLRRHIAGQPEIYFIGQFHRLQVRNAVTGVRIDNMYPEFGITIADSSIEGSLYAIRNVDPTSSVVKLIGTELLGDVGGSRILQTGGASEYAALKAAGALPDTSAPVLPTPPRRLYDAVKDYGADRTGSTDSAQAIQDALDAAGLAGGGVVYLPAGLYKVEEALQVPAHTELRGSAASAQRDQIGLSRGTILLADYGYATDETSAKTADALITLSGEAAGVRGLRLFYPGNEPNTVTGAVRPHAYAIRGLADDTYVTHVSLAGATFGIEFKGTAASPLDSPVVKGVSGTYYRVGIRMEHTTNGKIDEVLANATVVARSGLGLLLPQLVGPTWPSDANGKLTRLYDAITRPNTIFIQTQDAEQLTIGHSFTFGSHTFLQAVDSAVRVFNSAGDNLQPSTGRLFDVSGSDVTAVNMMRFQGQSLQAVSSDVTVFNRLSLRDIAEPNLISGVSQATTTLAGIVKTGDDLPAPYHVPPVHPVLNGIDSATLDATPGERDLDRWDIAWQGTPTGSFFDLNGTAMAQAAIWRGGLSGGSAFADAGWGLIMNAYETADQDQPGAYIYNKTDIPADATDLRVIARSNPADSHLSGRGALRVRAAYRGSNGLYTVVTLPVALSAAQTSDSAALFVQNAQGWVTFEAPPTADASDSFAFDLSGIAGKPDVSLFIEANDRMEAGGNRADRVIVLAVRIS